MMHDRFRCPACRAALDVRVTAYGERAICPPCNTRWTRIIGEPTWVAERR